MGRSFGWEGVEKFKRNLTSVYCRDDRGLPGYVYLAVVVKKKIPQLLLITKTKRQKTNKSNSG